MGNLGAYQLITTISKKLGGPFKLLGIVAVVGYGVFRGVEAGFTQVYKIIKKHNGKRTVTIVRAATEFVVEKSGKSNEGFEFKVGEKFRILEQDGDAVLIDKLEDPNTPFFVSAKFLSKVSSFA